MGYEDACKVLNDLAHVIVPFDKTRSEFQALISRLKIVLRNQSGPVQFYSLICASGVGD